MANNRHLVALAVCLTLAGTGIFLYKVIALKFPMSPATQIEVWDIEVKVHYRPTEGPAKVRLHLPSGSKHFSISDEQFVSFGYGLGIKRSEGNRRATWSSRNVKGEQILYYRATVRPRTTTYAATAKEPDLVGHPFSDAQQIAAEALIAEAKAKSADNESLVLEIINRIMAKTESDPAGQRELLLGQKPSLTKRLEAVKQLLALEKIPARVVNGIQIVDMSRSTKIKHWLEVFHDKGWTAYEPSTGQTGVPKDYLPWWHDNIALVNITGGDLQSANIAISRNSEPALLSALWREKARQPVMYEFSLQGLPIETQLVYRVLLSVPIGVLLLVILRNIVGIKTFGTFMPVLIAMSFRETQLLWGIILFCLVVGIGLAIRFYLEKLKLLLVPRLASVLIFVIITMALISVLAYKLGFHGGLSVALFPMVILTMTIERMSIVWEESGAEIAIKQGLGSLFAAACAYLLMNINLLQHLLFVFPELLLIILSFTLLLGRYSGYRLLELYRFKALARDIS